MTNAQIRAQIALSNPQLHRLLMRRHLSFLSFAVSLAAMMVCAVMTMIVGCSNIDEPWRNIVLDAIGGGVFTSIVLTIVFLTFNFLADQKAKNVLNVGPYGRNELLDAY